jgi:hypothetical protein
MPAAGALSQRLLATIPRWAQAIGAVIGLVTLLVLLLIF